MTSANISLIHLGAQWLVLSFESPDVIYLMSPLVSQSDPPVVPVIW